MPESNLLPLTTHPLRQSLYDELHARPFHLVATPQQISHLAVQAGEEEQEEAFTLLKQLCRRYRVNPPPAGGTTYRQEFGDFVLHWERHMEFYSLTLLRPCPPGDAPFSDPTFDLLPVDWAKDLPGQAVAAFHLTVDNETEDATPEELGGFFEGQKVILSEVKGGKALLGSAFKLHGDGFGRFMIRNRGLSDAQMGRLVRRLIDLETYRLLSQISLPLAKRIAPELESMDQQLAKTLSSILKIDDAGDERDLLQSLSRQAARLESFRAETNHRFSATRAYHDLVLHRLQVIGEEKVEGYLTMGEFITRRLTPAQRTCQSVQDWMEDLSRRIERAGDLLRTRVNLTLQEQNRSLLASMNRRSRLQFRLQETVEGLSIAAISYYLVGLVGYLIGGLPLERWHLDKKVLMALSVPVVLGSVWWLTHRIKHRLIKAPAHGE
ncbi:DUF3422 domain-containing protein [Desulfuromonas sp.]|uniref:DUF3422 family protein n=1 Tax=Desulfuromonas sp. TaxID=892 RepID=UPI0025BF76E7|nr:DUF3422 domain-containing protein [Desulfuromonas sp.]